MANQRLTRYSRRSRVAPSLENWRGRKERMATLVVSCIVTASSPSTSEEKKETRIKVAEGMLLSYWEIASEARYTNTRVTVWLVRPSDGRNLSETIDLPYLMRTIRQVRVCFE